MTNIKKGNPKTSEEFEIVDAPSLRKFMNPGFIEGVFSRFAHVYIWGPSAFLVSFATEEILSAVRRSCPSSDLLSLGDTDIELRDMVELYGQPALLGGKNFCRMKIGRQTTSLLKYLKGLDAKGRVGLSLILGQVTAKTSASLQKELKRLNFYSLYCGEPKGHRLVPMIKELASLLGLRIGLEESQYLVDCCGEDLQKVTNELNKLILVMGGDSEHESITKDRISEICSFLRQDHVFHLDRLLLAKRYAEASLFITELIKQGESSLPILGLLARHCRNAIRIRQNLTSMRPAGAGVKLPQAVVKSYTSYVGDRSGASFEGALKLCQGVDAVIKSSGSASEILLLTQVLTALAADK